jgi:hypothetical protein
LAASSELRAQVESNRMLFAINGKDRRALLDAAYQAMSPEEEHVLSGLAGALPYICTSRGLHWGEKQKAGLFKQVSVHRFVPRDSVARIELAQHPAYSFTTLRAYDADDRHLVGISFDELSGNNLDGLTQARAVARALGIELS